MSQKKKSKSATTPGEKLIAKNSSARADYLISDTIEAGLQLTGTEVKSLRSTAPNIKESFVEIKAEKTHLEAFLVNANIAHYEHGNIWNHVPTRTRKLLLHRIEIDRLHGAVMKKGMTIVPLRMYFKKGRAKIELGLGKGKKKHDKRDADQKRTADREMERAKKRDRF